MNALEFIGRYKVEHLDVDGSLIGVYNLKNGIVTEGINKLLDIMFRNQTQIAAFYIGLIDNASFANLQASDTMASHAGWIESVIYSEGTRQAWVPAAASAQSITSNANAVFSINATGNIKGLFLASNSTKSGSTGFLWSTATFTDGVKSVVNGQSFKLIYTLSAS